MTVFYATVAVIVSWILGHKSGSDRGARCTAAVCTRLMLDGVSKKQIQDALQGAGKADV